MFWLWLLTVGGVIVVWQNYQRNKQTQDTLADYSLIPIAIVQLFFTVLVTGLIDGIYNPLARFPGGQVAADGQGMNPLLQTPLMAIHPPTLYIGWISLTIPFAFAVGALASGRIGSGWILRSRRMDAIFMDYTDHRYHARWQLGVSGTGLGWLLGMGPRRKRLFYAVAPRHRVSTLCDDPREAEYAQTLEYPPDYACLPIYTFGDFHYA